MKDLSFLEAMGWTGPTPKTLAGRDLSAHEQGQTRRCLINLVKSEPIFPTRSLIVSFYAQWSALQSESNWWKEYETSQESGILIYQINTDNFRPRINPDGSIQLGKALIHRIGDNLEKPIAQAPNLIAYQIHLQDF